VSTGVKLGLFGLLLVAVLGVAAAIGVAVGPIDTGSDETHGGHEPTAATTAAELPAGGLLVSQDGYTFTPEARELGAGPFAFTIEGPDGHPVTDYDEIHDRELHLIIASRDLRQYAHLHPLRDEHGRWSVDVPDLPGGAYRAFADFRPAGADQLTLGIDLTDGSPTDARAPLAAASSDAVAGFDVTLETDAADGTATVTVRRDGKVVTTEPYLGAAGHLVALRDGDLAYLHVHPLDDEPEGPVAFGVEYPSAGTYALFFDFQVDGQVHTARFAVHAEPLAVTEGSGHGHA
jgi:hypothetical protein